MFVETFLGEISRDRRETSNVRKVDIDSGNQWEVVNGRGFWNGMV